MNALVHRQTVRSVTGIPFLYYIRNLSCVAKHDDVVYVRYGNEHVNLVLQESLVPKNVPERKTKPD